MIPESGYQTISLSLSSVIQKDITLPFKVPVNEKKNREFNRL